MQCIILGMHRSGTSMLAGLMHLMGIYFGSESESIGANEENRKGFWERRDVVELNQSVLESVGADWFRVSDLSRQLMLAPEWFSDRARRILTELDGHRPWVIKDPRLCLLFPLWRELLQAPVCIHIYRSPLQVAESLRVRNGFPLNFGVALWENYNRAALAASASLPRILVHHRDLVMEPVSTVERLHKELLGLGVSGIRLLNAGEINSFVDLTLFRSRAEFVPEGGYLNEQQADLVAAFEKRTVFPLSDSMDTSAGAMDVLTTFENLTDFRTRNEALEARTAELDAQLLERKGRSEKLEQRVAQLDGELLSSKGRNRQLEQRVAQLDGELLSSKGRNQQLEQRVAQLDGELLSSKGRNQQLERRVDEMDAEREALQREAQFDRQLQERRDKASELGTVLRDLEQRIELVFGSSTWKLRDTLIRVAHLLMLREPASTIQEETRSLFRRGHELGKSLQDKEH